MKIGIILDTKEPEKAWNAFRFANTSLKRQHSVKLFPMGEAADFLEESISTRKVVLSDDV